MAVVVVDPRQDEQVDQVIGLLGGKMAVGKLEATDGSWEVGGNCWPGEGRLEGSEAG